MARIQSIILDKTGTLTDGRPQIASVLCAEGEAEDEIVRLAASLDQASKHPIAQAIVTAARVCAVSNLCFPPRHAKFPGEGVSGLVDDRPVVVGGHGFVARHADTARLPLPKGGRGSVIVAVAVSGRIAGYIVMADPVREEVAGMLAGLRREGVQRILLATGDRAAVAERIAAGSASTHPFRPDAGPEGAVVLTNARTAPS